MARSIKLAVDEALDAAVQQRRITADERPSVKQFVAFKGGAAEDDPQRYYLTAQLSEYLDVGRQDVVGEIDLAGRTSPLVLVLVRADAQIRHHVELAGADRQVQYSETVRAGFLTGDIASGYLSAARMGGLNVFSAERVIPNTMSFYFICYPAPRVLPLPLPEE